MKKRTRRLRRPRVRHLGWPSNGSDTDTIDGLDPRLDSGIEDHEQYTICDKDWL